MARNFTRELLKAYKPGRNRIVYSSAPYEGWAVEYSPRNKHDRNPWVLQQDRASRVMLDSFRFSGRECRVQTFRYAVVALNNSFVVLDTHATTAYLMVPRLNGIGLEKVTGVLAVSVLYSSRYAATDVAKRLEKDGQLVFAQQENIRRAAETVDR
jgi:hypothetical protein